jgi:GT2 family glycosyltransferase
MKVSASVVTYRSDCRLLSSLIDSLIRAIARAGSEFRLEAEIVCVINDSERRAIESVLSTLERCDGGLPGHVRISVVEGHGNVGYGAGQNRALQRVTSDYHMILNPDVCLDERALLESLRYLQEHPEVAMLVPQGFDVHNEYARLAKRHPTLLVLLLRALAVPSSSGLLGRRVARYTYGGELPCDTPKSIVLASGCCMLCRTEMLRKVNGFDERYFLYFEDYDLSLRIKLCGEIVELPQARITHYGGHTARRDIRHVLHFLRSGVRFFNQYGWRIV